MRARAVLSLLPLVLLACDEGTPAAGASASSATIACDPLQAHVAPTSVGAVRAVGRDSVGRFYVLTNDLRVFTSQDGGLRRRRVEGSGTIGNTKVTVTLRESETQSATLQLDLESGTPRMGIVREPVPGKTFVIGEVGEELTVVAPALVVDLAASEELGATLQHRASLADGRLLVVTAPTEPTGYDGFRGFFGPKDALVERRVQGYARTQSLPGADFFQIEIDGVVGTVQIGNGPAGTGELRLGGEPNALTELSALPESVGFSCFAP